MQIHDGAYGTLLAHHLRGDETVDDLCVRTPVVVVDAHRAYIEAGAQVIGTNAFLAHLRGTRRRRRELQLGALACAREAAALFEEAPLIAATIGPAGVEPRDFWDDFELMLDADVRAIRCETIIDRVVADAALAAWADVARGVDDVELLVGCSVSPSMGAGAVGWVRELAVDAPGEVRIGLNCCEGPGNLRPALAALCDVRGTAWVMPSAGLPSGHDPARPTWPLADPNRWAEAVGELVHELPVDGIGGCCGTTPASIASLQTP